MPHLTKRSISSFKLKYPIFPCYKSFTIFSPMRRVEKFFAIRKGMKKGERREGESTCVANTRVNQSLPPCSSSQPSANGKFNLPASSAFLFDRAQIQNPVLAFFKIKRGLNRNDTSVEMDPYPPRG